MRSAIIAAVAAGLLLCAIALSTCSASVPAYRAGYQSSVHLIFSSGASCTGTVVGKRTILTASHCHQENSGGDSSLTHVDFRKVSQVRIVEDGNDHSLIFLGHEVVSKRVSTIAPRMADVGTEVYVWGNPGALTYQLRVGRVAGILGANVAAGFKVPFNTATIDMNNFHGDSGAGIFDYQGRIVGVLYGQYQRRGLSGDAFALTIALPIKFTRQQMESIR